jgi:hypothetical protein
VAEVFTERARPFASLLNANEESLVHSMRHQVPVALPLALRGLDSVK